jgi:hypothetical protein
VLPGSTASTRTLARFLAVVPGLRQLAKDVTNVRWADFDGTRRPGSCQSRRPAQVSVMAGLHACHGAHSDHPARLIEGPRLVGWYEALGELDITYPGECSKANPARL